MQNRKIDLQIVDFEAKHLNNTFDWMQDPELKRNFLIERNISKVNHLEWYRNYLNDYTQKIFAIIADGNHIGNIGLKHLSINNKTAETWVYLGDRKFHGLGLAYQAYLSLFEYLINININCLYARIVEFNKPSFSLYNKLGFIKIIGKNEIIEINGEMYSVDFFEKVLF